MLFKCNEFIKVISKMQQKISSLLTPPQQEPFAMMGSNEQVSGLYKCTLARPSYQTLQSGTQKHKSGIKKYWLLEIEATSIWNAKSVKDYILQMMTDTVFYLGCFIFRIKCQIRIVPICPYSIPLQKSRRFHFMCLATTEIKGDKFLPWEKGLKNWVSPWKI